MRTGHVHVGRQLLAFVGLVRLGSDDQRDVFMGGELLDEFRDAGRDEDLTLERRLVPIEPGDGQSPPIGRDQPDAVGVGFQEDAVDGVAT